VMWPAINRDLDLCIAESQRGREPPRAITSARTSPGFGFSPARMDHPERKKGARGRKLATLRQMCEAPRALAPGAAISRTHFAMGYVW
jgi:hypothetical protein